jgi:DNA helicase-2/ATP-dependent DNA helicase PcrA
MSPSTQAGLEEERRLFYVALTRARKQLTIYVPLRYHHRPRGRDGLHSYAQPSRSSARQSDGTWTPCTRGTSRSPQPRTATASVSADLDALWA